MRKKILYVIGQLGFGGAEKQLYNLVLGLDRQKYWPNICVLSNRVKMIEEFKNIGVSIIILKKYLPLFDISRLFNLLFTIRKLRPDILHSFLVVGDVYACPAGMLTGVPVLVSERNVEPVLNPETWNWKTWLKDMLISRAAGLIANSRAGAARAMEHTGIHPSKVYVVHNGINLARFDKSKDVQHIRKELGLKEGVGAIGIIGSIVGQRKDHDTFFRGMQILKQNFPHQFQILCVGSGPWSAQARRLVQDLDLEEITIFAGERDNVPDIMATLDLIVSSSQWEGMPNVVMEAMAAGKPVVATAVGGTPELVVHGETGLLIPPKDPQALAQAAHRLLADPDLALQMGKAGRSRIEQYFTNEKMVSNTEKIYQHLLEGIE